MAPLPENNTECYFVDYTAAGENHTMLVRVADDTAAGDFGDTMNAVLGTIDTLLYQLTINQVRRRARNSTITFPVISGIEGNTYGSGAPANDERADFINFVGRSIGGRRVSLAIFGANQIDDNFRATSSESSDVAATVALLNSDDGIFLSIDGLNPVWYPYVNMAASAYWQRKLRTST